MFRVTNRHTDNRQTNKQAKTVKQTKNQVKIRTS